MTPKPESIDIVKDGFDFSKWHAEKKKGKRGTFYQVVRKDGRTFSVTLPGGNSVRVSVIWIEQ